MSHKDIRERLIALGPERLADALLGLAVRSDEADRVIRRMTATPSENIKAFKSKLAALSKSRRFIDWRGASAFARELNDMLESLGAGCDDPEVGLEQITAFFEADARIFEQCDDSSGNIGSVFQCSACDLFARYASDCPDKARTIDLLIELNESDEYGVRGDLIEAAHRFLHKDMLRALADRLRQESREPQASHRWLRALASVARQLKDAPMYEEALRAARPELHPRMYPDIAKAYLDAGDAQTALSWLERAHNETSGSYGHDDLLLQAHLKLGNARKAEETAWRIFRGHRSQDNLAKLLSVIGEDRREQVVQSEVESIMGSDGYNDFDARFLIDAGRMDEAEDYLLAHADELDGDYYTDLLPMAESMEKDGRYLAATVVYRALLNSILRRGVSKYYHHGIRYLNKLDCLEKNVGDWRMLFDHDTYKTGLRQAHRRKSSFWSLDNRAVQD